MITREQVTALHLQPGDVVRVTGWDGLTVEGPVSRSNADAGSLWLGSHVRLDFALDPSVPPWLERPDATITVIRRAPRPLYVNHPRTEPTVGDVVRAAVPRYEDDSTTWTYAPRNCLDDGGAPWVAVTRRGELVSMPLQLGPGSLRLLVDGETGQAVPS